MTTKTAGRTAGHLTGSTGQATKTPRAGVAQLVERQLPNVTHGSGDPSDTGVSCEDSQGRCTATHRGESPDAAQTADRTAGPIREPDDQTRRDLRRLDTDEDRRFWSAVDAAAREVETWPAWRRGVSEDETRAEAREVE